MTSLLALALWALQAAAPRPVLDEPTGEPQDPDRVQVSVNDFKALLQNNIFSPLNPKRSPSPKETPRTAEGSKPSATRAAPPLVTGIFFDTKEKTYEVSVEDRNPTSLKLFREPKFLKAGDEFLGYKIESIRENIVVVKHAEVTVEVRVGQPLPGDGPAGAASDPAPAKALPAPTLDAGARNEVLEEMKKRLNKKPPPAEDDP